MHSTHQMFTALATACGLMAASAAAQAQVEPPPQPHVVKFGVARYTTDSRTTGVTGIGIPPGADATTGDATTVLLTYEYQFQPYLGLELVLGVPPKIKARASGSVAFLGEVLTARNVSPTVLLTYHFGSPGSVVRPYAGLGFNYTRFVGISTPYNWDVQLSDSLGLAAHVGVDIALGKTWGLYASYAMAETKTDLIATGATVLKTTIDFRPRIYSAGLSLRF